jgi:transposase
MMEDVDTAYRCAAGIDISKVDAKVCVRRILEGARRPQTETRVFGSTMAQIRQLRQWLVDQGVEHVVMESTSAYWKPFWAGLIDAGFRLTLSNALAVKQMRGRKTDISDAGWLAKLAALDMAPASFVPPDDIRQLRLATRGRAKMVTRRTSVVASLEKLLEDTGMKLSAASSKLLNVTGVDILELVCEGVTDPTQLAEVSRLRRVKKEELVEALEADVMDVHRVLIRVHLDLVSALDKELRVIDKEITRLGAPYETQITLLDTIPGVDRVLAVGILAEVGVDMSVFPTAKHLAAWAGVAPGSAESAGKTKRVGARKGDKHMKRLLSQAAQAGVLTHDTFPKARFNKVRVRRGPAVAYTAVARSMATAVWAILTKQEPYRDLGGDYYTRTATTAQRNRLQANAEATLARLGVAYTINNSAC